jgi:hypothetical protein
MASSGLPKPSESGKTLRPHWIGLLISNVLITLFPPAPRWLGLVFLVFLAVAGLAAIVNRILNCTPPSKKLFERDATERMAAELDAIALASMDPTSPENRRAGA